MHDPALIDQLLCCALLPVRSYDLGNPGRVVSSSKPSQCGGASPLLRSGFAPWLF